MSPFEAANPGASLTDFCVWYEDPVIPLSELDGPGVSRHSETNGNARHGGGNKVIKSKSIRLLERTRDFWAKILAKTPAVPAAEQEPLFSASNTVEIALDYLETLHPANLLCSVMAANLSNAYFALAISAGDAATKLPTVHLSLTRLRRKIETALKLLAIDTTHPPSSKIRAEKSATSAGASSSPVCFSFASLQP
jgi:hypothetical protein